jgi:hypothetical protein
VALRGSFCTADLCGGGQTHQFSGFSKFCIGWLSHRVANSLWSNGLSIARNAGVPRSACKTGWFCAEAARAFLGKSSVAHTRGRAKIVEFTFALAPSRKRRASVTFVASMVDAFFSDASKTERRK